jgi:hypothetical protein
MAHVTINAPADPGLANVWRSAIEKFLARTGRAPATPEDLRDVTRHYHEMLMRPHGALAEIVSLYVRETPVPPQYTFPAGPIERRYRFRDVELKPGLVVRLLRDDEVSACQASVREAGIHEDPEGNVRRWWRSTHCWPTVVEYRGRIWQYDFFHVHPHGQHVHAGHTRRPFRDRSAAFWREVRRPVLEQLIGHGFSYMESIIRADRRDWVEVMVRSFDATETGTTVDGRWVRLRYDLARSLSACTGWPARRTANVPGVLEITPAQAIERLEVAWGDRPRKADAIRMAEEWWLLDEATLLDIGGHVRVIRERSSEEARLAMLTPVDAPQPEVSAAIRAWCRAAGYRRVSSFLPIAQSRASAAMRAQVEANGFRVVREVRGPSGPALEVIAEVDSQ